MGCHTWIYKHIPEKQEYYKNIIIEEQRYWAQYMIDYYNSDKDELRKDYKEFIEDCKDFLKYINETPEEEVLKCYSNKEQVLKEVKWTEHAVEWTYEEYIDWAKSENQKIIDMSDNGEIKESGSFKEPNDNSKFPIRYQYELINDKLYIHGLIPHGNDIGRIHDYNQPDCFTAQETIECFKNHNVEYDENLINELFENNDIFVHFG